MAVIPVPATFVAGLAPPEADLNSLRNGINFALSPPLAELRQTVTQSLPNAGWTALTFDTEIIDTDGGHSTATNTSRYVVQTAGWYLLTAGVSFAASATGGRGLRFAKNGAAQGFGRVFTAPSPMYASDLNTSKRFLCAVGDYLEVQAFQNSGAALNTNYVANDSGSFMEVQFIHT